MSRFNPADIPRFRDRYVPLSMLFWCMAGCLLIGFIIGKIPDLPIKPKGKDIIIILKDKQDVPEAQN